MMKTPEVKVDVHDLESVLRQLTGVQSVKIKQLNLPCKNEYGEIKIETYEGDKLDALVNRSKKNR